MQYVLYCRTISTLSQVTHHFSLQALKLKPPDGEQSAIVSAAQTAANVADPNFEGADNLAKLVKGVGLFTFNGTTLFLPATPP
jgi:hypothetical protein